MKNWRTDLDSILASVRSGNTAKDLAHRYGLSTDGMQKVVDMVMKRFKAGKWVTRV